jgi:hypothetical protein
MLSIFANYILEVTKISQKNEKTNYRPCFACVFVVLCAIFVFFMPILSDFLFLLKAKNVYLLIVIQQIL